MNDPLLDKVRERISAHVSNGQFTHGQTHAETMDAVMREVEVALVLDTPGFAALPALYRLFEAVEGLFSPHGTWLGEQHREHGDNPYPRLYRLVNEARAAGAPPPLAESGETVEWFNEVGGVLQWATGYPRERMKAAWAALEALGHAAALPTADCSACVGSGEGPADYSGEGTSCDVCLGTGMRVSDEEIRRLRNRAEDVQWMAHELAAARGEVCLECFAKLKDGEPHRPACPSGDPSAGNEARAAGAAPLPDEHPYGRTPAQAHPSSEPHAWLVTDPVTGDERIVYSREEAEFTAGDDVDAPVVCAIWLEPPPGVAPCPNQVEEAGEREAQLDVIAAAIWGRRDGWSWAAAKLATDATRIEVQRTLRTAERILPVVYSILTAQAPARRCEFGG
jgi:hypothetical protein